MLYATAVCTIVCNVSHFFVKWRIKSRGLVWHVTWILLKGKEKISKIVLIVRHGEQTCLTQKCHRLRNGGSAAGQLFVILGGENNFFNTIWIIFRTVLKPFKITKVLGFESQLKKSNW